MANEIVVGIDVAKGHVDVAAIGAVLDRVVFTNDTDGQEALAQDLATRRPAVVLLEASGGYEADLVCALQAAGLTVAVINPTRAREFARSMGRLAKTDRIDAASLAQMAAVLVQRPDFSRFIKPVVESEQQDLAALVVRRRQLVTMLGSEQKRLATSRAAVRPSLKAMIEAIRNQLDRVDAEMQAHVAKHHAELNALLRSAKGVGPIASASLIAQVPELGRLNRRQISALVGLAPFPKESGTYRGKRRIYGGRFEVRRTLYMAALVATRHNPVIRAFYRRLVATGKSKKLVLIACARKLLTMLNAMVRDGKAFEVA